MSWFFPLPTVPPSISAPTPCVCPGGRRGDGRAAWSCSWPTPTSHGGSSQQACISHGDGPGEETESWTETANPRVTWLSTPMNHPSGSLLADRSHSQGSQSLGDGRGPMGNTQPREKRPRQRRRAPNLPVYVCVVVCACVSVYTCACMYMRVYVTCVHAWVRVF